MANILLTRIDNRLVHGQVGSIWTSTIGANLLVVVDDTVAEDELQQQLMGATADASGVGIRFFTIEKTIATIEKASSQQKIFIICRTPSTVRKLVDGGVAIKQVNVGNMHFSEGKKSLSSKVYVDEQDIDDLKNLVNKDVEVYIQDVPTESKKNIQEVL